MAWKNLALFYSDFLLGKVDSSDEGYSFREMEITFADGVSAGTLVDKDGVPLAAADAAKAYGMILDQAVLPGCPKIEDFEAGKKYVLSVVVRGATINAKLIKFADGTSADVPDALEALSARGIKPTHKYFN